MGVSVPLRGKGRDQRADLVGQTPYTKGVSVPLRGKGRDQLSECWGDKTVNHVVSVPLRGKGRDQRKTAPGLQPYCKAFPSPCGEKVGINDP